MKNFFNKIQDRGSCVHRRGKKHIKASIFRIRDGLRMGRISVTINRDVKLVESSNMFSLAIVTLNLLFGEASVIRGVAGRGYLRQIRSHS